MNNRFFLAIIFIMVIGINSLFAINQKIDNKAKINWVHSDVYEIKIEKGEVTYIAILVEL